MKLTSLLSSIFLVSSTVLALPAPKGELFERGGGDYCKTKVGGGTCGPAYLCKGLSFGGKHVCRRRSECCVEITCYTHNGPGLCRYPSDGCEDGYFFPSKGCPRSSKCCVKRRVHHEKPDHKPKEEEHPHWPKEHKPKEEEHKPKEEEHKPKEEEHKLKEEDKSKEEHKPKSGSKENPRNPPT